MDKDRTEQTESCLDYLTKEVTNIQNIQLRKMCLNVLSSEKFAKGYGSSTKHHNWEGGLVVHTAEVMNNALLMAESNSLDVCTDELITAIVYHDYAKILDYELKDGKIVYTDHCNKIRHVTKSYGWFMQDCVDYEIPVELQDKIGHIILAHHGRLEWGSPVEPQTTEAYIIHFADMLSAKCSKDYYKELS